MKSSYLCIWIFSFLALTYGTRSAKSDCLEKEKALASLEIAENLLARAKGSYPSCKKSLNSTDQTDCDGEKSLAYIEISRKLISDVRRNFPSCSKPIVDDKKNETIGDIKNKTMVEKYGDCSEILATGRKENGIYTIWPKNFQTEKPLKVYCDMETDGGGWTVIQRRGKYEVQQDFNLNWESYENGFGNLTQEFWLGNENIRLLCLEGCKIHFDLTDGKGVYRFAVYQTFNLTSNYVIEIGGYTGNATNAMMNHNHYPFSTKDRDVSGKAKEYQSGWWHGLHYFTNLNGVYRPGKNGRQYVYWWKESNDYDNLASVEMKVKPS